MEHHRVAGVDDAAGGALGRAGAVLVIATCSAAAYRAAAVASGDVAFVAFVIVSYSALLLLLHFRRAYGLALPEAAVGSCERLRHRVWALCMLLSLSVMFAWKFASVMPWPVAVGVWARGCSLL